MYQFFVEKSAIDAEHNRVYIDGDNYNHLVNVLRIRSDEEFLVTDGEDGNEYHCHLLTADGEKAECEIRFVKLSDCELPIRVHLYQGLPKSDKMELIIQKMTELGAVEIIPVAMSRCIMKLEEKKIKSKVERWNAIALSAASQSKRKIIPTVREPLSYKEAMHEASGMDTILIPYELSAGEGMEKTRQAIRSLKKDSDVAVFIGPEGGISEAEFALAKEAGGIPISLGRRILRTETAGLSLMSMISYEVEE